MEVEEVEEEVEVVEEEEEEEGPTLICSSRMGASFDLRYLGGKRGKNIGVKRGTNQFVKGGETKVRL